MAASRLRVGVAGPVGSGKTALVEALCRRLRDRLQLAVVTNDIYTQEDAQFLTRAGALEPARIRGVETGAIEQRVGKAETHRRGTSPGAHVPTPPCSSTRRMRKKARISSRSLAGKSMSIASVPISPILPAT